MLTRQLSADPTAGQDLVITPMQLLVLLQHGDSQFPSGSFAFSAGLEGLLADGMIDAASLPNLIRAMLHGRWAHFERIALGLAWRANGDMPALIALDAELEASLLAPVERAGSARAGAALITTHLRLGTPAAVALRAHIERGALRGHRLMVEGMLWRQIGLDELHATLLSGYGFVLGLCTAAVRLGKLGALTQQAVMAELMTDIAALAAAPWPLPAVPRAFNPLAEIAMMRHAVRDRSLFAT